MDPRTLVAYNFYKVMFLDEIYAKIATAEVAAATPPPEAAAAPTGVSATTSTSTLA
jgi:hypothetical protein